MTASAELDAAYASQLKRMREAIAASGKRAGWKVAFNDPAVQQRLGLDGPLVGWLDPAALLSSGGQFACREGRALRLEAEIAIRLRHRVCSTASPSEAAAAIGTVAPALELVDYSRPAGSLSAMVEHSFFHAATVIGEASPFSALTSAGTALEAAAINGLSLGGPLPGRVPDDLGPLVVRVASLLERYGEELRAGDIVICGSYIDPTPLTPGDRAAAQFRALGEVGVTLSRS